MSLRLALVMALVAAPAFAQQESQFGADLRREQQEIAQSCNGFSAAALGGCAYTLATDSPFHVALGSLAPLNGFAFGLAFDEHYTPNESWRISWNADGVGAPSGAWRAGAYMRLVHTPATSGVAVRTAGSPRSSTAIRPRELPVINVFVESTSLKTLNYFGPGQESSEAARTVYGERETLVGGSVTYPVAWNAAGALHPALIGGITGRVIDIRSSSSTDAPPIQNRFDEATAPGLTSQDAFLELIEGIRFRPSVANGWLRFDYLLAAEQFRTSSITGSSFSRWTIDLQHEIPLYRRVSSTGPRAINGPDECHQSAGAPQCPPIEWSRNREGSIGVRALLMLSTVSDANQVPFFLQPTLGGSDINGERLLASYQDYRFRGPDLLALQEHVEHSIWGPIGAFVLFEQGKVGADAAALNFKHLVTSTSVGLTLRAGGFPMINLSFAWGAEGQHTIASMDPSLLGGAPRPSLY